MRCSLRFLLAWILVGAVPGQGAVNHWTSQGPSGGAIFAFAVDPQNPAVLYAGSGGAVLKSTDGGATWTGGDRGIGGGSPSGNASIRAIVVDPSDSDVVWVGTLGGVFRSTDAGAHWPSAWTGQTPVPILALAVDPAHPSTAYAGSSGAGVFKTTDGGATWSSVNRGLGSLEIVSIDVEPAGAGVLVGTLDVATSEYGDTHGLAYHSTDGGGHWSRIEGLGDAVVHAFAFDAAAGRLWAATDNHGVLTSSDGGTVWIPSSQGLPLDAVLDLVVDPLDPSIVYAGTLDYGVYRTDDGGLSWAAANDGLSNPVAVAFGIDPTSAGRVLVATTSGLYGSADRGESWSAMDLGLQAIDIRQVAQAADGKTLFAAGYGAGMYRSTDTGLSWEPAATGLGDSVALTVVPHPSDPRVLFAGTWFHGVRKSTDGGDTWASAGEAVSSGYSGGIAFDPQDPSTIYATLKQTIVKSTDGGASWSVVYDDPKGNYFRCLAIDPVSPSNVYAGSEYSGVIKTADGGATWVPMNDGLPGNPNDPKILAIVESLAVDPANPSTILAGTFGLGIRRSTDGGAHWIEMSVPEEVRRFSDWVPAVTFDSAHPHTAYIGYYGSVLRSVDAGETWAVVGPGLPEALFRGLFVDTARGTIYAATRAGVFDFRTAMVGGGGHPSGCLPSEKTLCIDDQLGDRRFQVSVRFESHAGAGASGLAGATPLTSPHYTKGGVLHFFDLANPEMLVKILDGCAINGHFWVFYAAATSVGFEMTVADTQTREIKTYSNPDGHPAETVTDTSAFPGCPR